MNSKEYIAGFILLALVLLLGATELTSTIFFRLVVGLGLGYALSRASLGFAGSVNRAYRYGSTRLMRALMVLFTLTAIASTAFLYGQNPLQMHLWVNPINIGLLVGGLLFGFGMSIGSCCATGVMSYFSSNLARPLIVLFFFGMGVFLGFPLQATQSWIKQTVVSTSTYAGRGVYLPDLFSGDPLHGYLGAILLTALFAGIVIWISHRYEQARRNKNTYIGVESEHEQLAQKPFNSAEHPLFSFATYEALFIRRWSAFTGITVIVVLFSLLMGVTGSGWGASSPFGFWFGRLLIAFGIDPASVAAFTHRPEKVFTMPFFSHSVSVQNLGILIGSVISLLLSGRFGKSVIRLQLSWREVIMLVIAGLSLGLGTRLANGCNVGALYTPIANFSLSGWIFLVVMVLGAIAGNKFTKKFG
ncbi:YeeE/YedE family protein [Celerinatantimonas sp. MCCC 1A17872]|uniref:YeeE/YedE family protein n=1 Tax=Celerinatantimonas sp. MCCC 1A17872 TaxID=3177514 RepID=UPI0038C0A8AD